MGLTSAPISIPLSIQLPNADLAGAVATPPRLYAANLSPGEAASQNTWSVLPARFNSPTDNLRGLWHAPHPPHPGENFFVVM